MQGKGVVRFFLILLTIICIYQLFFFVPANRVENDAAEFATSRSEALTDVAQTDAYNAAYRAYLDSMSNEKVWSLLGIRDFTYADVKQQQVALGLDLKGGMSVVMQVDLRTFLEALSDNTVDPEFVAALDAADAKMASAQSDYITLFVDEFRERANGKTLASIFSRNESMRDVINFQTEDGEVARLLREKANETVGTTYTLLKERIDRMGVLQPNVSLDEARDLIVVELPGIDNPQRARDFLQAAAALDFYDVYRNTDPGIFQGLINANDALTAAQGGGETVEREISRVDTLFATDDLGNQDRSSITGFDTVYTDDQAGAGALFSLLQPFDPSLGATAVIGYTTRASKDKLVEIFKSEDFTRNFPKDLQFVVSQKPVRDQDTREFTSNYSVYALRTEGANAEPALSGVHIVEADQSVDVGGSGEVEVNITMDATGSREWAEITTSRVGREFAIVLDGEVVSAPVINQAITGGRSRITGGFTIQEAQDLASKLEVGRLPTETRIIQENIVGPSLGAENINSSIKALLAGFVLVLLFMLAYYSGAGIVSIIALLANIFFIFGALSSFGTVLTLPGIAGIVLTIGMAVDANVIIYERIREEIRAGKATLVAIKDGFNASYSAIIDANVTTLLTALVLNYWGLGPIKGFAVVLMIGIFTSLFTAVLVTRLIIDWRTNGGRELGFSTSFSEKILSGVNVDWMGKRKIGYMVSGVLIIASLASIFTRGFDLGVDFRGGYSYTVAFVDTQVESDQLRDALITAFDGESTVVKAVDVENTYNVTTSYQVDNPDENASALVEAALYEGVSSLQSGITLDQFTTADLTTSTRIVSSSKVGPTIADDIRNSSFKSGVFALILIFLYLFIRFSRWEFSAGAVAALFHDVIITLGMFSLLHGILPFSMEIDQAFVAAILTVIGYSVNDTVVVFDRIREFIGTYTGRSKEEIFNLAINSTLSRTLITSLTTLFVVGILFAFGGGSIKGFAFALLIGILVGTYSSIFVASATVNDLVKDIKVRKTVTKTSDSSSSFTRAAEARKEAEAGA